MDSFEPSKLLIAGDVHGNERWFGSLCKLARHQGCDAIVQLGDFGYWPHTTAGRRFLEHVEWHAERNGVDCVYWIDGNHENHDLLAELESGPDGMVAIGDRCRYLPRGHRWQWRSVRFGALGGAFSVDRRERVQGESWWPAEVTTDADVERLGDGPLDVLVTHDAPEGTPLRGLGLPPVDQVLADEVRARIRLAVESTEPRLLLHGHWHHRYSHELTWPTSVDGELAWRRTQVEGLAADVQRDRRSWAVLELEPLRFVDADELQ